MCGCVGVVCDVGRVVGVIMFRFFFNDAATTEIYTLSLHDALPIYSPGAWNSRSEGWKYIRFRFKSNGYVRHFNFRFEWWRWLTLNEINIVNGSASGTTTLSSATTIGDVISLINNSSFNVTASINSAGNSMLIN